MSPAKLILNAVILAPLLETFVFQTTFCALAQIWKLGFWGSVVLTWLPFAAIHFFINIPTGMKAGLILGFYLSFTYVVKRSISLRSAVSWTAFLHALNNAINLALASLL